MSKRITVPDSWNEVTIGQFQEIAELDRETKDYDIHVASILIDEDPDLIRKFDVNSTNAIMRHLEWVIKMPAEDSYKQEIEVDGITYEMIENLNGFSNGEWNDMEFYMEDRFKNFHLLVSMFYRPSGEEYSVSKVKKRAAVFAEKVMVGDIYGAMVFFSLVGKRSMLTTQDYLTRQMIQN